MARRHGASEALLNALHDRASSGGGLEVLEPGWRAALAFADAIHADGTGVPDAIYAPLSALWDEAQIVEITLVIGMTEYFNRFNNALRVEPTK